MGLWKGIANGIGAKKRGINWSSYWTKQFTDAAEITDATQIAALKALVGDLLAINTVEPNFANFDTPADSICLAIYPFAGTTAAQQKFNLINPADTDAAYRLTFSGSMAHDATGIKGDGASTGVATHLSTTKLGEASHGIDAVLTGGVDIQNRYAIINGTSPYAYIQNGGNLADANVVTQGATLNQAVFNNNINRYTSVGLFNVNRTSLDAGGLEVYLSGIKTVSTAAVAGTLGVSEFYFLRGTLATRYSNLGLAFASIRKSGVSEAAITLYNKAITDYLYAIGRMPKNNIVFEGHSFMDFSATFPSLAPATVIGLNATYADRVYRYVISASSGAVVDTLIARKTTAVDPYYISNYDMNNIIPLWIGANDVTDSAGTGTAAYNKLKTYYNTLIASGWIPIVFTMTEKAAGAGQQEAERVIFNNLIRTDLNPTYLIDCDNYTELSDSTDTTYFRVDQLHLNTVGDTFVADLLIAMIKTIV